eukprot:scaffold1112_cov92-Amphora_coffeaeformis.AAC.13
MDTWRLPSFTTTMYDVAVGHWYVSFDHFLDVVGPQIQLPWEERDGTKVCSSNPLEEQRSIDVYYPEQADVDDNLPFLTRTIPTTLKRRHFYIFMAVLFRVSCRLG